MKLPREERVPWADRRGVPSVQRQRPTTNKELVNSLGSEKAFAEDEVCWIYWRFRVVEHGLTTHKLLPGLHHSSEGVALPVGVFRLSSDRFRYWKRLTRLAIERDLVWVLVKIYHPGRGFFAAAA